MAMSSHKRLRSLTSDMRPDCWTTRFARFRSTSRANFTASCIPGQAHGYSNSKGNSCGGHSTDAKGEQQSVSLFGTVKHAPSKGPLQKKMGYLVQLHGRVDAHTRTRLSFLHTPQDSRRFSTQTFALSDFSVEISAR